jgi:hypothetical protein
VVAALSLLAELATADRFGITGDWGPSHWRRISPSRLWTEAAAARQLVTAAGTTVWEAAVVGIPVVLLMTAANQRLVYRWARDAGIPGLNALLVDPEFLAHQLRALLDVPAQLPRVENGVNRVVQRLAQLAGREGRS